MQTIIFSSSFEGTSAVGSFVDKPTTTSWAATGTHSAHYFGDYESLGTLTLSQAAAAAVIIEFELYVPGDSTESNALRIVGLQSLAVRGGRATGDAVALAVSGVWYGGGETPNFYSVGGDIGVVDTLIHVKVTAGPSGVAIFIDGSSTAAYTTLTDIPDAPIWSGSTDLDMFHSGGDNYAGAGFYFYVDDLIITGEYPGGGGGGGASLPSTTPPPTLPPFLRSPHELELLPVYASVPRMTGHARNRRLYAGSVPRIATVALDLTNDEAALFFEWYENVLLAGQRQFSAQIANQGPGLRWWASQWIEGTYKAEAIDGGGWMISGQLRLTGQGSVDAPPQGTLEATATAALLGSAALVVSKPLAASVTVALLPPAAVNVVAVGSATGVGTATGRTSGFVSSLGSSAGTSTVSGLPLSRGTASGTSSAAAGVVFSGAGAAAGTSSALASGASASAGAAAGTSSALASGASASAGAAAGTSSVLGYAVSQGLASGSSTVSGVSI